MRRQLDLLPGRYGEHVQQPRFVVGQDGAEGAGQLLTPVGADVQAYTQENATSAKEQKASTVGYIVNGDPFTATVYSDEEAMTLCNTLMDYAESGQHVAVGCTSESDTLAKNTLITFSSTSRVEVTYWVSNMVRRGYAVTIDYDKKTGVYNCTAYRKNTP